MRQEEGCFQNVKVIKFESNSQLASLNKQVSISCFQNVKVIKFESNSQQGAKFTWLEMSCFQNVKVIKFESNSQPVRRLAARYLELFSECQSYKV